MDRRIQRTRNSLFSAFIELRATKPVEKITVKELTEKANISKQTFYLHFQDIYDLSEFLENDALLSLIGDIPNPEYMLTNPAEASRQLCGAFINQGHLFSILFPDDNRSYGVLTNKLDALIKEKIYDAANRMDLWGYGGFGLPRIELEGDRFFVIEEHDGLIEYGPDLIKISAGELTVSVEGTDMEIKEMDRGSLALVGRIVCVTVAR